MRTATTPKLMIFDFDGTIADSHDYLADLSLRSLAEHNITSARDIVRELIGLPTRERFTKHGASGTQLDNATETFSKLHAESTYEDVPLIKGFVPWIHSFPEATKWILSAAPEHTIHTYLSQHQLSDTFQEIISIHRDGHGDKSYEARRRVKNELNTMNCRDIWYFGDEISDLQAAGYIGAISFLLHNRSNHHLRYMADFSICDYADLPAGTPSPPNHGTGIARQYIADTQSNMRSLSTGALAQLADAVIQTVTSKGVVYLAGNGGCHSIAEHFATDLRRVFSSVGSGALLHILGSNNSTVSAFGNDLNWESALRDELIPILKRPDLLLVLSTSGCSPNLLLAEQCARQFGTRAIAMTPSLVTDGGSVTRLAPLSEDLLAVSCHVVSRLIRHRLINVIAGPTLKQVSSQDRTRGSH
ncbi:MAG: HAD hydrolase-like protein [Phycisphaerales bacterium]